MTTPQDSEGRKPLTDEALAYMRQYPWARMIHNQAVLDHIDAQARALSEAQRKVESFTKQDIKNRDYFKSEIARLEAELAAAKANARTPGTVECCARCNSSLEAYRKGRCRLSFAIHGSGAVCPINPNPAAGERK